MFPWENIPFSFKSNNSWEENKLKVGEPLFKNYFLQLVQVSHRDPNLGNHYRDRVEKKNIFPFEVISLNIKFSSLNITKNLQLIKLLSIIWIVNLFVGITTTTKTNELGGNKTREWAGKFMYVFSSLTVYSTQSKRAHIIMERIRDENRWR